MRGEQPYATARVIIGKAVPLVAKDPEHRNADRGFVDNGAHKIDEALRRGPGAVGFHPSQLIERHEITGRDRLFGLSKKMSHQGRAYLRKRSARRRHNSEQARYPDLFGIVVFRNEHGAGAADIARNSCEGAVPTGLIEHAVVNITDQIIQASAIAAIVRCGGQFRNRL